MTGFRRKPNWLRLLKLSTTVVAASGLVAVSWVLADKHQVPTIILWKGLSWVQLDPLVQVLHLSGLLLTGLGIGFMVRRKLHRSLEEQRSVETRILDHVLRWSAGGPDRRHDSLKKALPKLVSVLRQAGDLQSFLRGHLDLDSTLSDQHSRLSALISEAGGEGRPCRLDEMFVELRRLRLLRSLVGQRVPRAESSDFDSWLDEVETHLSAYQVLSALESLDKVPSLPDLPRRLGELLPAGAASEELRRQLEACAEGLQTLVDQVPETKGRAAPGQVTALLHARESQRLRIGKLTRSWEDEKKQSARLQAEMERAEDRHEKALTAAHRPLASYLRVHSDTPAAVLSAEQQGPRRHLRLRLLPEHEALQEALASAGGGDFASALRLQHLCDEVGRWIGKLEEWGDDATFWRRALEPALAQGWLHALLRAGLVLGTYYPGRPEAHRWRPVRALAEAFRQALLATHHKPEPLRLLAPPPAGAEVEEHGSSLTRLSPVIEAVHRRQAEGTGFVVDVTRFAVQGSGGSAPPRVVLYSLADWHASQVRTP